MLLELSARYPQSATDPLFAICYLQRSVIVTPFSLPYLPTSLPRVSKFLVYLQGGLLPPCSTVHISRVQRLIENKDWGVPRDKLNTCK